MVVMMMDHPLLKIKPQISFVWQLESHLNSSESKLPLAFINYGILSINPRDTVFARALGSEGMLVLIVKTYFTTNNKMEIPLEKWPQLRRMITN